MGYDAKAVIRWVRADAEKYGFDTEHIAVGAVADNTYRSCLRSCVFCYMPFFLLFGNFLAN